MTLKAGKTFMTRKILNGGFILVGGKGIAIGE